MSCKEGLDSEGGVSLKTSKEFMIRIIMPREEALGPEKGYAIHVHMLTLWTLPSLIPQSPFKFSCLPTHLEGVGRVGGSYLCIKEIGTQH
jgi:hypothetical protein